MQLRKYVPANEVEAYANELVKVAKTVNWRPEWLAAVIEFESGHNPKAINPTSNATGLIQFMPSTALGLGTSTQALYQMTRLQQLSYVEKYLFPYRKSVKDFYDAYASVFLPLLLGKSDSYVIPDVYIQWNPLFKKYSGLDGNPSNVTKMEWKAYLKNHFKRYPFLFEKSMWNNEWVLSIVIALCIITLFWLAQATLHAKP